MKFSLSVATLLVAAAAKVHGLDSPIPGYGVVDMEWEIETTPGGPTKVLTGTIEQAVEQLIQINPNFLQEYNLTDVQGNAPEPTGTVSVSKRQKETDFQYNCGAPFPACIAGEIFAGIQYLQGVSGQPTNGPGPGNCGRVSCSYDSAIYWCNDNAQSYTLSSYTDIANGARSIYDNCQKGGPNIFTRHVSGQAFLNSQDWNVIVKGDSC